MNKKKTILTTCLLSILISLGLTFGPISPAWAHSVFIFAWVEADNICTDSYFAKKSKVRGGQVSMKNETGKVLETGITDDKGGYCFKIPEKKENLVFVVEAGEGHRAEFLLRTEDLGIDVITDPVQNKDRNEKNENGNIMTTLDNKSEQEVIRSIVRDEMKAQLSPLIRSIAESQKEKDPGLKEIIGGLGWLLGIVGLHLWLKSRNKTKKRLD